MVWPLGDELHMNEFFWGQAIIMHYLISIPILQSCKAVQKKKKKIPELLQEFSKKLVCI